MKRSKKMRNIGRIFKPAMLALCFLAGVHLGTSGLFAKAAPALSSTRIFLPEGTSKVLKVKNANGKVRWTTAAPKIATVSQGGRVKGIKGGTTIVAARVDGIRLTCRVLVGGISLNKSSVIVNTGRTYQMKAIRKNIISRVRWSSSRPDIASVDSTGKVTAKKRGLATITAKAGKCSAACRVRVLNAKISQTSLSMKKGGTDTLRVTGTTLKPIWKSSNPAVAYVDSAGKITAVGSGNAVISAVLGSSRLNCTVTVATDKWMELLDQYRYDPETNQLVFVKYIGGSRAKVMMYEKRGKLWKRIVNCSGYVGRNGIDKVQEGDKKTPTGTFTLTHAFGIKSDPGAKLPYVQVNHNLYWCGDEAFYNQLIDITQHPHSCTGEHLIDYPKYYDYGMFLDYNKECTYKKGSAIFLHCTGYSTYTAGCVAVDQADMIKIIQNAEKGTKICIYDK